MKKILAFAMAVCAFAAVGCNPDGTGTETMGDAVPATEKSIVGDWYYPNTLLNLDTQPEFSFKADGTVTGTYEGKWSIIENGVLKITFKNYENNDEDIYMLPYTMYKGTVLIMRFDIPEVDKDGRPVINQGKGYVQFFYKDGKANANNIDDIQGKWANIETWDNGDGTVDSMTSVSVTFKGNKFDLVIHVWNGESYSGTCTYKNGIVSFHPTSCVYMGETIDPKNGSMGDGEKADFDFPFIANGDEAYAYIIEGRGAWKKQK